MIELFVFTIGYIIGYDFANVFVKKCKECYDIE